MSPTIYPDPPPQPPKPVRPPQPAPEPSPYPEDPEYESPFDESKLEAGDEREPVAYRGATSDPTFGYLIAVALSIGLMPLIPANADLRYVLLWTVMAGFGVLSWLMGTSARIWTETPDNLAWGVSFGLLIAVPLLIVGGAPLQETVRRLFVNMSIGEVLAFLVFVIPLAETLFFRGVLQETRRFWLVGLLSTVWSGLVFFPLLDVARFPAVAVVIGVALVMMNVMYSYVRQRNGLAAAWACQLVVNLVLLFVPFI
jgi:hypothetical protein